MFRGINYLRTHYIHPILLISEQTGQYNVPMVTREGPGVQKWRSGGCYLACCGKVDCRVHG